MKGAVWFIRALIFIILAACVGLYTQRIQIQELLSELSAPVLPEEVGYEEVVEVMKVSEVVLEEELEEIADPDATEVAGNPVFTETLVPSEPPIPSVPSESAVLNELNLAVPFTSQAPHANWDEVHEETCEEASIYMVHEFYQGTSGVITQDTAETELQKIIAQEMAQFGFYKDTTADETAELIKALYGYTRVDVLSDPSADDLKALIATGHPIIVPAAGRQLGNPNFSGIGPLYHMLVIRGYTETQFITNDPGTRRGEAYVYDIDTIMNAMHDWNGGDVENGAKKVIVVYPNE